jgi:hypothetical protein
MLENFQNLDDWEYMVDKRAVDKVFYASAPSRGDRLGAFCIGKGDLQYIICGDTPAEVREQIEIANLHATPDTDEINDVTETTWLTLCHNWRGILYKGTVKLVISGLDWFPLSLLMSPGGTLVPDPYTMVTFAVVDGEPLLDEHGALHIGGHPADVINALTEAGYGGEVFDEAEFHQSTLMDISVKHKDVIYREKTYNTRQTLAENPMFVRLLIGDREEELIRIMNLKKGVNNED